MLPYHITRNAIAPLLVVVVMEDLINTVEKWVRKIDWSVDLSKGSMEMKVGTILIPRRDCLG